MMSFALSQRASIVVIAIHLGPPERRISPRARRRETHSIRAGADPAAAPFPCRWGVEQEDIAERLFPTMETA